MKDSSVVHAQSDTVFCRVLDVLSECHKFLSAVVIMLPFALELFFLNIHGHL